MPAPPPRWARGLVVGAADVVTVDRTADHGVQPRRLPGEVVALCQVRRTACNLGMDVHCGLQVAAAFTEVRRHGGVPGEGGVERGQGRQSRAGPGCVPDTNHSGWSIRKRVPTS